MMAIKAKHTLFNSRQYVFFLFFLFMVASTSGQGIFDRNKNEALALDSLVRYGRLENGFTYYLRKNEIPTNQVELNMVIKAGTYHEDEDQLGYAHLLEHLLFKETKNFPELRSFFLRDGRKSNAKTGYAHTWYFATIPSEDKKLIEDGLLILRDWARGIRVDQSSIDVERAAVLGEMRTHDPYRNWINRTIEEKILEGSDFKTFHEEKEKKSIQNFDMEAFIRYYDDWYRPDLEAAIIVGNIDLDSIELKIKQMFSDLKMPDNAKSSKVHVEAQKVVLDGNNRFSRILDTVNSKLKMFVLPKFPNYSHNPKTQEDYQHLVLQELYWLMLEGKKQQLEQQYDPPYSNLSLNYNRNQIGGGKILASLMRVEFELDDPEYVKNRFIKALQVWKRLHVGYSKSDLEKSKNQLFKKYLSNRKMSSASLALRYKDHFVKGTSSPHPKKELNIISQILEDVDLNEIQALMIKNGDLSKNINFLFFSGDKKNIPANSQIIKWIKEVESMEVSPIDPLPPPIESLAEVSQLREERNLDDIKEVKDLIGVSTIKLENGIKLVLKPTKPGLDIFKNKIFLRAFKTNTVPFENREEYLASQVFPEVVKYSGAGPYTRFELDRFKLKNDIRLDFRATEHSQVISGESKTSNVDELLNLLFLYSNKIRMSSEGFSAWKDHKEKQLSGFGLRGSSAFIEKEIFSLWYPEIPKMEVNDLDALTVGKVSRAKQHWFSSFSDYTFIVTGDFENKDIVPLLIRKLSGFPGNDESPTYPNDNLKFPLKKMDEIIYLNNINQAYVHLYFPVKTDGELKTEIELELLSKALGNRIWKRLRNGCYAPSGGGEWIDKKKGIYAFRVYFNSELGNEEKMIQYAMEEFQELKENGVEEEWLKNAVTDEVKQFEGRFGSFGYFNLWPDYLQKKFENGEDHVKKILQYGTIMEHFISVKDINAAAKRLMTEENLQQFRTLPKGYQVVQ